VEIKFSSACYSRSAAHDLLHAKLLSWVPFIDEHFDSLANFSGETISFSNLLGSEIAGFKDMFRSSWSLQLHLSMLRMSLAEFYRFILYFRQTVQKFCARYFYYFSTHDGKTLEKLSVSTSLPATTTSTSGARFPPLPTQDGISAGNADSHFVVSGNGCRTIANDHGITFDNVYLRDPALHRDCTGLYPDKYIFVSYQHQHSRYTG